MPSFSGRLRTAPMIAGERVLVTGASGFIGRRLCARLHDLGVEVHGVSREARAAADVTWHQADLGSLDSASEIVGRVRPAAVFHLAGLVTGTRDRTAVVPALAANLLGAVGILAGAADAGCRRVVLAGSMEERGNASGVAASPYAAAKRSATVYAEMMHAAYGVSVVNLRLFMVYGPGQRDRAKLVPYTITSLLGGRRPSLSSGTRLVDWVYVDDVVEALIQGATCSRGDDGAPIEIGSGSLVSIREIVSMIATEIGSPLAPRFDADRDRPNEMQGAASLGRADELLGWAPTTSLTEGLAAAVAWYKLHPESGT